MDDQKLSNTERWRGRGTAVQETSTASTDFLRRCGLRLAYPRRLCTNCTTSCRYTAVEPSEVGNGRQHVTHRPRLVSPQCRSRVTGHFKSPNNCSLVLADCYLFQLRASRVPLFAALAITVADFLFLYQTSVLHSRSYTLLRRLVRLIIPSISIHSLISRRTRCNSAKPPVSSWSALLASARAPNLSVCSSDSLNYPRSVLETS